MRLSAEFRAEAPHAAFNCFNCVGVGSPFRREAECEVVDELLGLAAIVPRDSLCRMQLEEAVRRSPQPIVPVQRTVGRERIG